MDYVPRQRTSARQVTAPAQTAAARTPTHLNCSSRLRGTNDHSEYLVLDTAFRGKRAAVLGVASFRNTRRGLPATGRTAAAPWVARAIQAGG